MKRYCFDTSGISNPLEQMPSDIHKSMWASITDLIESGVIAVTPEIYSEMVSIPGDVGDCIRDCEEKLVLEVGDISWDWANYVTHSDQLLTQYKDYISEYTGGSSKTVCLNDMTIITMAKTLALPLVSMEVLVPEESPNKRRIPNICQYESINHMWINDFLRNEGVHF